MAEERATDDVGLTEGAAAQRFIAACDYRANADYPLFAQEIASVIGSLTARRIIEIGSGPGSLTPHLRRLFPSAEIVAFDGSAAMSEYASRRYSEVATFELAHAEALPVPPNSTDLVVSFNTLHQLSSLRPAFREILRVLRNGGVAYLSDLNRGAERFAVSRKLARMHPDVMDDFKASIKSAFTAPEIANMLRSLGCHSFTIKSPLSITHDLSSLPKDPFQHQEDLELYLRIFIRKLPS